MTATIMTHDVQPLHIDELSDIQRAALTVAAQLFGRPLVDPDGYVTSDEVSERLRTLEPVTSAYERGQAAGHAEAAERAHIGDAISAEDAATWFTAPVGLTDVDEYERGFVAGFGRYFAGRPVTLDAGTLHRQLERLRADIDALSEQARVLAEAADRVDVERHGAEGEQRAIELVDEVADVARVLRTAEDPARNAVHLAWTLTLPALRG